MHQLAIDECKAFPFDAIMYEFFFDNFISEANSVAKGSEQICQTAGILSHKFQS